MIVAFDADILCLLLYPSIAPPIDPGTGRPVERALARLQHLVAELEASRARIVLPAPGGGSVYDEGAATPTAEGWPSG